MARETPLRELNNNQPRAIAHALAVLEEIATAGAGVTAREIAASLDLSPATTYRILNLLVREEYVVRLGDLSGFALGARIGALAEAPAASAITRAVSARIEELRGSLHTAVHLFSVYGNRIRVLDEDPRFALAERARVLSDLRSSAAGALLLADTEPHTEWLSDSMAFTTDLTGRAATATHLGPLSRHGAPVASIAAAVRDDRATLVNILMVSAKRDYVVDHGPELSARLLAASTELSPLLS
jgi:DNA-binding IclR family transcriptional regulator